MNVPCWRKKRFSYLFKVIRCKVTNDKRYLCRKFERKFKRKVNIKNPKTFNEKVTVRMLNSKNSNFTRLADKVSVREWVAEEIGESYLVPIVGVYESFKDINFSELPREFVLKCNHDSGSVVICTNKDFFSIDDAYRKINFFMNRNMYYVTRERHYSPIKPKIICEEYINIYKGMNRATTPELYRTHCFSGTVRFFEVDFTDENGKESVNIYNDRWQLEPVTVGYPNMLKPIVKRPYLIDELVMLSEKLSKSFSYCRIDWFMNEDLIYFNEITFTPCAGRMVFEPEYFDGVFGSHWELNEETEKE